MIMIIIINYYYFDFQTIKTLKTEYHLLLYDDTFKNIPIKKIILF